MLPGGYWQPQKWKIFETVSKAAKQKSSFACSVLPMIADLFTRWRGVGGRGGRGREDGGGGGGEGQCENWSWGRSQQSIRYCILWLESATDVCLFHILRNDTVNCRCFCVLIAYWLFSSKNLRQEVLSGLTQWGNDDPVEIIPNAIIK